MAIDSSRTGRRRQLVAAGALAAIGLASIWVAGRPPWAGRSHRGGVSRAGTVAARPVTALSVPATSGGESPGRATPPWEAILTGTLHQRNAHPSGLVTITVAGRLSGSRQGSLTIILLGLAAGGGVALEHSLVDLDVDGGGHLSGDVVALNGDTLVAAVSSAAAHLELGICLRVDPSTGTVSGPVTAEPAVPGYRS